MTSSELEDYIRLSGVDPWGHQRDDWRAALHTLSVVQALAGINATLQSIATKKRVKPKRFKLEQFHLGQILSGQGVHKRQTQQDMLNVVKMIANARKAKVTIPGEGYNPTMDLYGGPAIKPHDPNYQKEG